MPGSAIESRITQAMKDIGPKPESRRLLDDKAVPDRAQAELAKAIDDLVVSTEQLANEAAKVRSRTVAFDPAATTAGLADCGVTVSSGLTATPSAVELKGGVDESYTVVLGGGTKPYIVQLQGAAPTSGLTVKGPAPFDSSILIQGTATLGKGQSFSILVMDASNPPKSKEIAVAVGGTAPQAGGTPPANAPAATRS